MDLMSDPHVKSCFQRARSELNDVFSPHHWKTVAYVLLPPHGGNTVGSLLAFGDDLEISEKAVAADTAVLHAAIVADLTRVEPLVSSNVSGESRWPGGTLGIPVFDLDSSHPNMIVRPLLGVASFSTIANVIEIVNNFELMAVAKKFAYLLVNTLRDAAVGVGDDDWCGAKPVKITLTGVMDFPKILFDRAQQDTMIDATGDSWGEYQRGRFAKVKHLLQIERYRKRIRSSKAYMSNLDS